MLGMDLLLESTKLKCSDDTELEGFGEEYSPDEEGMAEIEEKNLEESFALDSALLLTANTYAKLLREGKEEEAETLQENVVKNFFGKVKALILKMWNRIKDFFKSVKLYFQSLVQSGSKFAEQYEEEIKAISSVTIEGYNYKLDESVKAIWDEYVKDSKLLEYIKNVEDSLNKLKSEDDNKAYIKGIDEKKVKEQTNGVQALIKSCEDKKYNRKFIQLTLGRTAKPVQVTYNGSQLYKILTSLNEKLNQVSKDQMDVDKCYKEALDIIKKIETKLSSLGDDTKVSAVSKNINAVGTIVKKILDAVNLAAGIKNSCLKDEVAQAKKAAYKGIAEARKSTKNTKDKKKVVNASFDVSELYKDLLG